jgi:NAD(P)-dependent dehydrogenase (short-subunit alcohol dehydrogenase family)/acyl carrier protein
MELRGLRLWYLNESATQGATDWIYSLDFEAIQEPPVHERSGDRQLPAEIRRWIILADEQGIGARLGKTLEAQGDEVVCLYRKWPGDGSQGKPGEQRVSPEELDAVLASLDQRSGAGYHSIVHLWALDGLVGEEASANEVETSLAAGAENALLCMRTLARGAGANAPRLWLVTRAAQSVDAEDGPADPSHTAIWGLARTFAVEHPSLWGGIVDLPKQGRAEQLPALLASAIRKPRGEDQLVLRDGRLLAARLARVRLSPLAQRFRWLADATYVITGGFGGLGLALATWLVQQGVRHVALIGHSPLPPREKWDSVADGTREARRIAAIRRLEESRAKVYICCADVGNEESLTSCMDVLEQSGCPAIRGVIHAAGVFGYKPIQETTVDEFRELLHAKSIGGWLLHKWSLRRDLDCFVTFSSAAAILSSPFVGGYAAANAFLDGLAHCRRQQGMAALSINWGLWSGVGMTEPLSERELEIVNARGMGAIPADLGLETFGRLVQQDSSQLGVIPVDWEKWKLLFPAFVEAPFLRGVTGAQSSQIHPEGSDRRAAIAAAQGEERSLLIRETVRRHLAGVLGLPEPELDEKMSISRLGLDSLMATELRSRLAADTGCSLPLVHLLEGPSAEELWILVECGLETATEHAKGDKAHPSAGDLDSEQAEQLLHKMDDLSELEVDALLNHLLAQEEKTS